MRSIIMRLCVFLSLVYSALCGALSAPSGYITLENNPDFPGKCWDKETKTAYEKYELFTKECVEHKCIDRGDNTFAFSLEKCLQGRGAPSSCKFVGPYNFDLDYPQCCPKLVC